MYRESNTHYRTWLLRCWSESAENKTVWRFSLQASDRSRRGFSDVAKLVDFLCQELEQGDYHV